MRVGALIALLLSASSTSFAAEGPFLRLERIDPSACADSGKVTVSVAELALDGSQRLVNPTAYRLMIDGATEPSPPKSVRKFGDSKLPLYVSVVVQANLAFRGDIGIIASAVQGFVSRLPPRAKVSVLSYGHNFERLATQVSPTEAASSLAKLTASDSSENAAVAAFRAALSDLGKLDFDIRRILVLVSDGLDESADRGVWRQFGDLARAKGVPIHSVAYSATDDRGPLLNLGEITKRSSGTFRWAQRVEDLDAQLQNLSREIDEQLLLTFKVPDRCGVSHTMLVTHGTLRSNSRDTPPMQMSVLRMAMYALPLLLLVVGAGVFLKRRSKAARSS